MLKKLLIFLSFYLVYVVILYIFQRLLIYPGRFINTSENSLIMKGAGRMWLKTSFGRVEAIFSPANGGRGSIRRPGIIFAHGNYEIIDYCLEEIRRYNNMGIHVLLVEYPGYGRSDGAPSYKTIEETFTGAYDWLAGNEIVDRKKIFLHGRSLGGGPVCLLAKKRNVRGIILQSTFTKLNRFAWKYLVPPFTVKDDFNNLSALKSYDGPVLIFHGKHDNIISFKNGIELHKNSKRSRFIEMDCGHNDCPIYGDEFWESIKLFIEESLKS